MSEEKKDEVVRIMENFEEIRKNNPDFVGGVLAGMELQKQMTKGEANDKDKR